MQSRKLLTFAEVPLFQSSPWQREDLCWCGAVLKSRYFMVVEPDKSFTTLSSPRWQLDNNFSALFSYCHFFSFNIYPPQPLSPYLTAFCSPVTLAFAFHLHFSFIVAHPHFLKWFCWTQRQCWENWTGRHILSMGWVKGAFSVINIFEVKPLILMKTTQKQYRSVTLRRHCTAGLKMMLDVSKSHSFMTFYSLFREQGWVNRLKHPLTSCKH